jgi:hypothetical protein
MNESKIYVESRQQLWINNTISEILRSYIKDRNEVIEESEAFQEKL